MKQVIRIIGGRFRGKKIHFPSIEGLRPTPDRVRETLFNWLMNDIKEARCLDVFSGSGALGFEAFSRGAARVVFLEQSSTAHAQLQKNINLFHDSNLILKKTDALLYLNHCQEQFDVIFLDPPFAKNAIPLCLELIAKNNLLPAGGLLYTESSTLINADDTLWEKIKDKKAGQVFYGLFLKL